MQRTKRDLKSLDWSVSKARSPRASLYDRLSAAEFLVAFGLPDEADAAIAAADAMARASGVAGSAMTRRYFERLLAISRRFRDMDVARKVDALGEFGVRLLDNDADAVLAPAKRSRTLLVVLASMYNDFWVSYPVLHCLLPTGSTTVLYLKDPRERMYLGGLETYGASFDDTCLGIRAQADALGITDIKVMAFSGGGYAGLLLASCLGASAFLGFSIRTDLSAGSLLHADRYIEEASLRQKDGDMLFDLRPYLAARPHPARATLYYGDGTEIDAEHAMHLAGLPNVTLKELPETRHNTIVTLLADGSFEKTVRNFVA